MRIKDYVNNKGLNISQLAKKTGIPYSTLSDVINCNTDVNHISAGVIHAIAEATGTTMDDIYNMCYEQGPVPPIKNAGLSIQKGNYYLTYKNKKRLLCTRNENSVLFIKDIAEIDIELIDLEEELDSWTV